MSAGPDDDGSDKMAGHHGNMSIGERLSAARKARTLTTETVAEELKLDVNMIEAIERDDKAVLPAAIFVQGYLRRYARLVGLPEDELVRDYADSAGELPPLSVVAIKQRKSSVTLPSAKLIRNIFCCCWQSLCCGWLTLLQSILSCRAGRLKASRHRVASTCRQPTN